MIALLFTLLVPALVKSKAKSNRIQCTSYLKQIGVSFRLFSTDNQDKYPMSYFTNSNAWPLNSAGTNFVAHYFQSMSNELVSPIILVCPSDKRKRAASFSNLTDENISYFLGLDADESIPEGLLVGDRNVTMDGKPVQPGIVRFNTTDQIGFSAIMHNRVGNVALGDGSVQNLTAQRFQQQIQRSTNRLAFPH
ncbi:MAG: type II secretion system protein [Verrucomicrobiota bacterium]